MTFTQNNDRLKTSKPVLKPRANHSPRIHMQLILPLESEPNLFKRLFDKMRQATEDGNDSMSDPMLRAWTVAKKLPNSTKSVSNSPASLTIKVKKKAAPFRPPSWAQKSQPPEPEKEKD